MGVVDLVPMQHSDAESEVAFAFKRDALGPHISAKWGWEPTFTSLWNGHRAAMTAEKPSGLMLVCCLSGPLMGRDPTRYSRVIQEVM